MRAGWGGFAVVKPEDIPQDVWEAATSGRSKAILSIANWVMGGMTGPDEPHNHALDMIFARAIMDAKADAYIEIAEMVDVFADTAGFSAMNVDSPSEIAAFRIEEGTLRGTAEAIRKRGEEK